MANIDINKMGEALNTKADIDLNNTGVFSTAGGGVNLIYSTPADASGKEVTSADYVSNNISGQVDSKIDEKIESKLTNKANTDLSNCTRPYIVETWHEGAEWYRVWSDGWIEQGGEAEAGATTTITFKKTYQLATYTVFVQALGTNSQIYQFVVNKDSETGMRILSQGGAASLSKSWMVQGY